MPKRSIVSVGVSQLFKLSDLKDVKEKQFPVICGNCGTNFTVSEHPDHPNKKVPNPCHIIKVAERAIVFECCGALVDDLYLKYNQCFSKYFFKNMPKWMNKGFLKNFYR